MLEEILKKATFWDVIIILISSLAIVGFWRGIWGLMDIYLFPENQILSLSVSAVIGIIILVLIASHRRRKK